MKVANIPLRTKLILLLCAWAPLAAADEDGLRLRAGLASGQYHPDQEFRQQGDAIGAAFVFRGFGFNTEWENKEYGSIPLEAQYDKDRLRFSLETFGQFIQPSYTGYSSFSDFTYEGNPAQYTSLRLLGYDPVTRSTTSLKAGFRLNKDNSRRAFHVYAGARSYAVDYYASGNYLNTAEISQSGTTSGGAAYSRVGRVQELDFVFDSSTSYRAAGGMWGLTYEQKFGEKYEFRAHLGFYNLSGNMSSVQQTISLSSGSVTTSTATASSSASQDEAFYSYRSERGRLFVNGSEFAIALFYEMSPDTKLFVSSLSSRALVKDSEINLLLFTTNDDVDPYKDKINGETLYSLAWRYTYPGSTAPEFVNALTFGVEQKF